MTAIWSRAKLGDVCHTITDGSHNPPRGIGSSHYLMLSSKNVFDDRITLDAPRYLSQSDFESENRRTNVSPADVLLTVVGTVGRAAVVPDNFPRVTLQRSVAVLKPRHDAIEARFLMFALNSILDDLLAGARGVAQKGIYLKALREVEIPFPPLEEQKRIVAVLDQAFAALDRGRALAEANLADAEALYHPLASQLFQQDDPPSGWASYTLDDIAELRGGYAFKSGQYTEQGAFVLRTVNIDKDGGIIRGNDKFISHLEAQEFDRFRLAEGDTLFVMVGATLGKTGYVREDDLPALLNQNMWVVRARDARVSPAFLNAIFNEITKPIVENSRGAARSFVKRDDVRQLKLFLPPRDEQMRIMERIDEVGSNLKYLKDRYLGSLRDFDELRQSLLQKAFAGELT